RQLVDQKEIGLARQRRVEIELAQRDAAVLERARGNALEPGEQRPGLAAAVRLDHAGHHVKTGALELLRFDQHGLALPHAWRRAVRREWRWSCPRPAGRRRRA